MRICKAYTFKQQCIRVENDLRLTFGKAIQEELIFEIDEDMINDRYDNVEVVSTSGGAKELEPVSAVVSTNVECVENTEEPEDDEEVEDEEELDDDDDDNVTIYVKHEENGATRYFTAKDCQDNGMDVEIKTEQEPLELNDTSTTSKTTDDDEVPLPGEDDELFLNSSSNDSDMDEGALEVEEVSFKTEKPETPTQSARDAATTNSDGDDRLNRLRVLLHQRPVRSKAKAKPPFDCEQCGKVLRNYSSYKYHMQLHSDKTPFLCSDCGEGFKTRNAYEGHIMTHKEFNPNTCTICHKSYRQAASLRTHMLSHTGVKPFTCNVCGKGMTQR